MRSDAIRQRRFRQRVLLLLRKAGRRVPFVSRRKRRRRLAVPRRPWARKRRDQLRLRPPVGWHRAGDACASREEGGHSSALTPRRRGDGSEPSPPPVPETTGPNRPGCESPHGAPSLPAGLALAAINGAGGCRIRCPPLKPGESVADIVADHPTERNSPFARSKKSGRSRRMIQPVPEARNDLYAAMDSDAQEFVSAHE